MFTTNGILLMTVIVLNMVTSPSYKDLQCLKQRLLSAQTVVVWFALYHMVLRGLSHRYRAQRYTFLHTMLYFPVEKTL